MLSPGGLPPPPPPPPPHTQSSNSDDEHISPPHSVCALQVLGLVVKAMREAPGGPWLKCGNIMEQMEKDGFRFHTPNIDCRRAFLRNLMKREGRGLFAMNGKRGTSKYALLELVGEQPEKKTEEEKVKKTTGTKKVKKKTEAKKVMCRRRQQQGIPSPVNWWWWGGVGWWMRRGKVVTMLC